MTNTLICVGQAYTYTEAEVQHDALVYFDSETLEFFVMEETEGEDEEQEPELVPVADYVHDHPEWADEVRETIMARLTSVAA